VSKTIESYSFRNSHVGPRLTEPGKDICRQWRRVDHLQPAKRRLRRSSVSLTGPTAVEIAAGCQRYELRFPRVKSNPELAWEFFELVRFLKIPRVYPLLGLYLLGALTRAVSAHTFGLCEPPHSSLSFRNQACRTACRTHIDHVGEMPGRVSKSHSSSSTFIGAQPIGTLSSEDISESSPNPVLSIYGKYNVSVNTTRRTRSTTLLDRVPSCARTSKYPLCQKARYDQSGISTNPHNHATTNAVPQRYWWTGGVVRTCCAVVADPGSSTHAQNNWTVFASSVPGGQQRLTSVGYPNIIQPDTLTPQ